MARIVPVRIVSKIEIKLISAGAIEKLLGSGEVNAQIAAWSFDVEGHAQKCAQGSCELANKKNEHLYKVSTPCIDDHQFKQEEEGTVGDVSKSLLSNRPEMPLYGEHRQTGYSVVCKQTCKSSHETDKSL